MKYGPEGIRINSVCPGAVNTPLTKLTPEANAILLRETALARVGEPEELAEAINWLCSGKSSFVAGIALSVNGGRSGW